jgi:hypothetical protein
VSESDGVRYYPEDKALGEGQATGAANDDDHHQLALEDYQALEETAYLLRSPKNARRLLESVAELEAGGGVPRDLAEWG